MILSLGMERARNDQRQLHPSLDHRRSLVAPRNVAALANSSPKLAQCRIVGFEKSPFLHPAAPVPTIFPQPVIGQS
jgi:hypothetical protein